MKYDATDVAERYQAARGLPREVLVAWLQPLQPHLRRLPGVCLDLGCGTGRFTETLSRFFESRVIGIDVSATMLQKASASCDPSLCWFIRGDLTKLPIATGSADLAFMSMAYHHVNAAAFGTELRRAMRCGGVVGIRNTTVETLDKVPYCRFFPEAENYGRRHFPAKDDLITQMEDRKFALASHREINQVVASNWGDYCEKVASRTYSPLVEISDDAFSRGLTSMRNANFSGPVEQPIDLFIFHAS